MVGLCHCHAFFPNFLRNCPFNCYNMNTWIQWNKRRFLMWNLRWNLLTFWLDALVILSLQIVTVRTMSLEYNGCHYQPHSYIPGVAELSISYLCLWYQSCMLENVRSAFRIDYIYLGFILFDGWQCQKDQKTPKACYLSFLLPWWFSSRTDKHHRG